MRWREINETKSTPAQRFIQKVEERLGLYVRLNMTSEDDYDVSINRLHVEIDERGLGRATRTLTMMCKLADRMGITLFLEAIPEDDENMDPDVHRLARFYAHFGFVGDNLRDGGILMHRSPKQTIKEKVQAPTITSATMKNGEINRKTADRMVDPKGYFKSKAPISEAEDSFYVNANEDKLREIACAEGSASSGTPKAEDCSWYYDPALPLSKIASAIPSKDWSGWYKDELEMDHDDKLNRNWDTLSREDIKEPIIVSFTATGEPDIWDGWHRTAGQIVRGAKTIPAIVGIEKSSISESFDDTVVENTQLDELSRPQYTDDAAKLLLNSGYERLGHGSFGSIFRKEGTDYVLLKVFEADDVAYLAYLDLVRKHQDNPHFPRIIGKTIRVTPKYYAVRLEPLSKYNYDSTLIRVYMMNRDYGFNDKQSYSYYRFMDACDLMEEYPKLQEACDLIIDHLIPPYHLDLKDDNVMLRGKTIVIIDPVHR